MPERYPVMMTGTQEKGITYKGVMPPIKLSKNDKIVLRCWGGSRDRIKIAGHLFTLIKTKDSGQPESKKTDISGDFHTEGDLRRHDISEFVAEGDCEVIGVDALVGFTQGIITSEFDLVLETFWLEVYR